MRSDPTLKGGSRYGGLLWSWLVNYMENQMPETKLPVLSEYYVEVRGPSYALLTCKVCGRKVVLKNGDVAGECRALSHGISHGGVQMPLPPGK